MLVTDPLFINIQGQYIYCLSQSYYLITDLYMSWRSSCILNVQSSVVNRDQANTFNLHLVNFID